MGCCEDPQDDLEEDDEEELRIRFTWFCLKKMGGRALQRLRQWLLEVEMGFVWGVAGLSIIIFVFAAIWYIDPALLTLVLRFRQAKCMTANSAFLIGISNCSWTSCRLGCTREVYKCWQVQVTFDFVEGSEPYTPPWDSFSSFDRGSLYNADYSDPSKSPASNLARLYPNVRGCGYPPELNCEDFYETFGPVDSEFPCWVSTMDSSVAMTQLDLERAKGEVIFSLIPLLTFIVFVLYAFCRLGVFSVCNPLKMCPKAPDTTVNVPDLTPKKLMTYKRGLAAKKTQALAAFQQKDPPLPEGTTEGPMGAGVAIPDTILEDPDDSIDILKTNAEVLPQNKVRSRSAHRSSNGADQLLEDDLSRIEQDLFPRDKRKGDPFFRDDDDDEDTNTVINELFGEEIEMMDKERLAKRYDVVDLKDISADYGYSNQLRTDSIGSFSPSLRRVKSGTAKLRRDTSVRSPTISSNFSGWDDSLDSKEQRTKQM